MSQKMNKHTYPDKILPTVRSDMMAYHRHGYSFDDYCDRNTHGRNYGRELYPIWLETKEEYDAEISKVHSDAGQEQKQDRRGKRKQHV